MLTLLTATGARPAAWAICERLMARQTYSGAVRWIVVDDGEQQQPITFEREGWALEVIRPEPYWQQGQNTQSRNLLAGLDRCSASDTILIIEDDDWYSCDWLAHAADAFARGDLIGEDRARYYNLPLRRGRQLVNARHASLCSTGVRGPAVEALRQACRESPKFIDLELWRSFRGRRHLFGGHRVVGIKGLLGRGGIGMGHRADFVGADDASGVLLREWVGADAELYQ